MHQGMSYDDVRKLLNLTPNATCGYVRVHVRRTTDRAGGMAAPFDGGRDGLGALLHGDAGRAGEAASHPERSVLSLLSRRSDRSADAAARGSSRTRGGPDLRAGHHVQLFIPGNTFHTARVIGTRQWFLGGTTEWPGV